MADNEKNKSDIEQDSEEYQFSDLDGLNPDYSKPEEEEAEYSFSEQRESSNPNALRNSLIVLGIIIVALIAYKFLGSWLAGSDKKQSSAIPSMQKAAKKQIVEKPQPQLVQKPKQITETKPEVSPSKLQQRISAVEVTQQSVRSEVNTMNNQVSNMNSNLTDLSDKLNQLNATITQMANRIETQSDEISRLNMRLRAKRAKARTRTKVRRPILTYTIKALIPGRAWLIASNGSTLTIRVGSTVPGYGQVKLIDPIQGRVMMSTGKIIRFGEIDS